MNREMRKTVKLDSRERSSEFRKLYEITGVVGVGGGGTVYAGMLLFRKISLGLVPSRIYLIPNR